MDEEIAVRLAEFILTSFPDTLARRVATVLEVAARMVNEALDNG